MRSDGSSVAGVVDVEVALEGLDGIRLTGLVSVLSEFASTVLTDFSLQAILDHLASCVVELLPVTGAGATLVSSEKVPHQVAASNELALRFEQLQTDLGQGPCLAAHESGKAVALPDLAHADGFPEFGPAALGAGLAAVFSFPLRHGGGCLGALDLYCDTAGALTPQDLTVAQTLADVTTAYLLNAQTRTRALQAAEQFRDSALHDPLTGLANRVLLEERLEHAAARAPRTGSTTAVLFADLDGFKQINDTYGHDVGDEVLQAVAARLSALVRPGDTLARISGDEFVFLCEDLANASDVDVLTTRLAQAFADPFRLRGRAFPLAASVGTAYAGPTEAVTSQLVVDADTAMYHAKRKTAPSQMIDLTRARSARERRELRDDLGVALSRAELEVVYRPIVRSADRLLVGVEALLSWPRPTKGLASAALAVDLAEQDGLPVDVGAWVLQRGCTDHVAWVNDGRDPHLLLSVNVSALQLAALGFSSTVESLLGATGMDPTALVLEMGERIFFEDNLRARTVLADLKARGIRLALDHFGRDHFSLNRLRHLPLDIIKIDRRLVADLGRDPTASTTVGAIAQLARGLGLTVMAEGVDTERQHDEVIRLGCELGQGAHYGRAVSASGVASLLPGPRDAHAPSLRVQHSAERGSADSGESDPRGRAPATDTSDGPDG